MCANFGCLRSWDFNDCPEVSSRTSIARLWKNLAGYRRWAAQDGVITLAMAVVCECVCTEICCVSCFVHPWRWPVHGGEPGPCAPRNWFVLTCGGQLWCWYCGGVRLWNGHPWRRVWWSVFMGRAHRAHYITLLCARVWKRGTMRLRLCSDCDFCPSLDGLVERLYRKKLILACDVRSFV